MGKYQLMNVADGHIFEDKGWILDDPQGTSPSLVRAIYDKKQLHVAEDGSLAIRVTHEEFSRQLCYRFQKAIVSTSANISGEPSPATFYDISDEIKNQMDCIVNFRRGEKAGACPSQIVKLAHDGQVSIIRR